MNQEVRLEQGICLSSLEQVCLIHEQKYATSRFVTRK